MNDQQILDRITDRYLEEAGGDIHYALRLLAYDFHRLGGVASSGYLRCRPVVRSRFHPKAQVEAIDIPGATAPEASIL
jgi:hypothetical protein